VGICLSVGFADPHPNILTSNISILYYLFILEKGQPSAAPFNYDLQVLQVLFASLHFSLQSC
jgi:hypothetical protein